MSPQGEFFLEDSFWRIKIPLHLHKLTGLFVHNICVQVRTEILFMSTGNLLRLQSPWLGERKFLGTYWKLKESWIDDYQMATGLWNGYYICQLCNKAYKYT